MPATQRGRYQVDEQRVSVHTSKNINQNLLDITNTALTFQVDEYDALGMHDTVSNTTRIVCVIPGLYLVGALIPVAANAAGYRDLSLVSSAAGNIAEVIVGTAGGVAPTRMTMTVPVRLVAGEYLEFYMSQNSGSTLQALIGSFAWAIRLGN